jgi:murein L,D-transpeptidase YcbB/YkuD
MTRRWILVALAACLATAAPGTSKSAGPDLSQIQSRLRLRFEEAAAQSVRHVGGETVHSGSALAAFYEQRLYRPVWVTGDPPHPSALAESVAEALHAANQEGLYPADYHVAVIDPLLSTAPQAATAGAFVDLELALSDGLLTYASHLATGRVDPAACNAQWITAGREVDTVQWLADLVERGDLSAALAEVLPRQAGYARLVAALAAYRRIALAGGWAAVDPGPTLEPAAEGPRVAQLRERLAASGYPTSLRSRPDVFDPALEAAVRHFQERHGLEADGRVGQQTLDELNMPAAARARQIELNLERWRWLPLDLGQRYLVVNVPAFELWVQEGDSTVMRHKVVVGKAYHETPVFSGRLRYMVLNPYWEVPYGIAIKELIPLIRKDLDYLAKEKIQVLEGWGAEERVIDPRTLDWHALGPGHFPYRLRQDPGPLNALGRVKFMFPNAFDVYLHDTPAKGLFAQTRRDFSHGCIRVERPMDLAEYLMSGTNWTREMLEAEIASGRQTTVPMPEPVPIYVEYWTAWVEPDGRVQFRRDIYGRDATLDRAMRLACSP